MRRFPRRLILLFSACVAGAATRAYAVPSFDPSQVNLGSILPDAAIRPLLETFGILSEHRPFRPADSLGASGFDIAVEATLVHNPPSLAAGLSASGLSGSSSFPPALPMAKLHIDKGINDVVDFGLSGLYYEGNYIAGGDVKFTVFNAEEGPSVALRFSYTELSLNSASGLAGSLGNLSIQSQGVSLGTASLSIKTHTFGPQILISRKLQFADPYLGVGYDWTSGQISVPINAPAVNFSTTLSSPSYSSGGATAFTGVSFRLFPVPIVLVIEGAYSSIGMSYLGVMLGLGL